MHVDNGIVTLAGEVPLRTTADRLIHLARSVHGVIHVHNQLTYEFDDTMITGL